MHYTGFMCCLKLTYILFEILMGIVGMKNRVSFNWQELETWIHSAAFYCFASGKPPELTIDSCK